MRLHATKAMIRFTRFSYALLTDGDHSMRRLADMEYSRAYKRFKPLVKTRRRRHRMDKLRALQYFAAAAGEKSFSRAARRFGVSVPAVAKMINAFEDSLNAKLFDRTARGLTLTAEGSRYLEACAPALAELDRADEQLRASTARPKGTVV